MRISVDVPDSVAEAISDGVGRKHVQKVLKCTQREAEHMCWAVQNGAQASYGKAQEEFSLDLDRRIAKLKPKKAIRSRLRPHMVGVMQITDAHFGSDFKLGSNIVNSKVIADRLDRFSSEACDFFRAYSCDSAVVALTGDIIGSDRRLEELRQMPKGRAELLDVAFESISDAILNVSERFPVRVVSASGNESRLDQEMGFGDSSYNNSMDGILHKMLRVWGSNVKNVDVGDFGAEVLFDAAGQTVVAMHNCPTFRRTGAAKSMQQFLGRMAQERGIIVSYLMFGHDHGGACVTPFYGNGGTVVGPDPYGARGLNATCRPSQNVYVFGRDGSRSGMVVDLS